MRLIRSALVIIICAILSGCALTKWQTAYETKKVGKEKTFDKNKPIQVLKAINSISINDFGVMTISSKSISQFEELEAERENNVSIEKKAPDPVGAVLTTGLTSGVALIFSPIKTTKQAIGETRNERVISTRLDLQNAKKTGEKLWETSYPNTSIGRVLISGLTNSPIELLGTSANEFDLSGVVKEYQGTEISKYIRVFCKECIAPYRFGPVELSQERSVELRIAVIKSNLFKMEEEKAQLIKRAEEKARLSKEISEKLALDKLKAEIKEKTDSIPKPPPAKSLKDVKHTKCVSIGITPEHNDYKACIQ